MKTSSNQKSLFLLSFLGLAFVFQIQAQDSAGYSISLEKDLELVGVPLQHPALASGPVTSVQSGSIIQWTPSYTDTAFGTALVSGTEYYLEVVGPTTHPWLGHRLELDEAATRTRSDHALIPTASAWNTKWPADNSLVGATIEVHPHITLPYLVDDTLLRRIQSGGENPKSFQFFLPFPSSVSLSAQVNLSGGTLLWQQSTSARPLRSDELILPPGSSFGLKFGDQRGLSRGFTGVARTVPCPVPLQKGTNYISYPFAKDLRLGVDWGTPANGLRAGTGGHAVQADKIILQNGNTSLTYGLSQTKQGFQWLRVNSRTYLWNTPPQVLEKIPAGEGFVLVKTVADPNHFFPLPKP
ncbi:MAG: hypothetical protein EBS53_14220 [Bacteroidetes bacterium]|nr:hypothetical protein [Bacteroidota bacterium]